ncbi:MAG: hypothetical protein HWE07_09450 [Cytophagia bacterium]|nr:hypothetical protein [Cytophagia bacterium]
MNYKKLNIDWNAEPNAPEAVLEEIGTDLRLEFFLNPFVYHNIDNDEKGELIFKNCFKYSFNSCNDEGYFRGQYRYSNSELPWGEFYEIEHDWTNDFHQDQKILNQEIEQIGLKHFIFFLRDNTLECIAKEFEFNKLNKE